MTVTIKWPVSGIIRIFEDLKQYEVNQVITDVSNLINDDDEVGGRVDCRIEVTE